MAVYDLKSVFLGYKACTWSQWFPSAGLNLYVTVGFVSDDFKLCGSVEMQRMYSRIEMGQRNSNSITVQYIVT